MTGIYGIVFTPSGKIYVGQSLDIESRWKDHRSDLKYNKHSNIVLQNYYNKYGESAFEFIILEECSESSLTESEQSWIDKFGGFDSENTFNLMEASVCGKRSSETRKRMSEANKGKIFSEETRKKIGDARRGQPVSKETIEKLRLSSTGRKHSDEAKAKISEHRKGTPGTNLGKHFTAEHRRRISEGQRGRVSANLGIPMSDEQKSKIRESVLKNWEKRKAGK